jgi:hypothetical protein
MRILLSFFFLFQLCAYAQKTELIGEIVVPTGEFVGFDAHGLGYFIGANQSLSKAKNDELVQYQNLSFGRIGHVDLTNPLNIVVHYPDFNTVVMLDNQLNEIRSITFTNITEYNITVAAAGNASQNRLWIFDSSSQQLGLYSYLSNDFRFLTQPIFREMLHYETNFNAFRWISDQQQWLYCDVYGKISTVGEVPDFDHIAFVSESAVLYSSNGKLYFYNVNDQQPKAVDISSNSIKRFHYNDQILSIFTENGITNYKIILP